MYSSAPSAGEPTIPDVCISSSRSPLPACPCALLSETCMAHTSAYTHRSLTHAYRAPLSGAKRDRELRACWPQSHIKECHPATTRAHPRHSRLPFDALAPGPQSLRQRRQGTRLARRPPLRVAQGSHNCFSNHSAGARPRQSAGQIAHHSWCHRGPHPGRTVRSRQIGRKWPLPPAGPWRAADTGACHRVAGQRRH